MKNKEAVDYMQKIIIDIIKEKKSNEISTNATNKKLIVDSIVKELDKVMDNENK